MTWSVVKHAYAQYFVGLFDFGWRGVVATGSYAVLRTIIRFFTGRRETGAKAIRLVTSESSVWYVIHDCVVCAASDWANATSHQESRTEYVSDAGGVQGLGFTVCIQCARQWSAALSVV